jgi:hypothetical protein
VVLTFGLVFADYGLDASPPAETCIVIADSWAQWQYNMNWFLDVTENDFPELNKACAFIAPNPVYTKAKASFPLNRSGNVSVKIYNSLGQIVDSRMSVYSVPGVYTYLINTRRLNSGVYFITIKTPTEKMTQSFTVVK